MKLTKWSKRPPRAILHSLRRREHMTQPTAMKDSFDDVNFTPPLLSTITARTILVHGDRDFYPVHIALEMYKAIPNSYLAANGPALPPW